MFKFTEKQLEFILSWFFPFLAIFIALNIGIFFTISIQIILFIFWIALSWVVFGEGKGFLSNPLPSISVIVVFIFLVLGNISYLIYSNGIFNMISNIQILR